MQNGKKVWIRALMPIVLSGAYLVLAHEDHWEAPPEAKKVKNPISATEDSLKKGKEAYEKKCLLCHGETGDGKGPVAKQLKSSPGDLTNSKEMNEMTDGELFWKITTGSDPMPRFEKMLSADERWHVVNYIRTFSTPTKGKPNAAGDKGKKDKS